MESTSTDERVLPRTKVIRHLRQAINEGVYVAGDRLPPEQSFVHSLGVSRSTVRAALEEAERSGLIESRKHKGRWVSRGAPVVGGGASLIRRRVAVVSTWSWDFASVRHLGVEPAVDAGTRDMLEECGIHPIHLRLRRDNGDELGRELARERPKGVIVDHTSDVEEAALQLLNHLKAAGVPAVVQSNDERFAPFDRVVADHERGAYELARELIRRGRQRILRVWEGRHADAAWQKARDRGFERAMREAGLELLPPVCVQGLMARGGGSSDEDVFRVRVQQAAGFLIEPMQGAARPDAIMASTDGQISTLAGALRLFRLAPNEDVVLAGYDNYWWLCWERQFEETRPALTMEKGNVEIGRSLVRLLLEQIEEPGAEPRVWTVHPKLIVPGETAPAE